MRICRALPALTVCFTLLLAGAQTPSVPRHSPEFAIQLTNGKQVLLSQFRGKAVALVFILTHCPHCQQTVQILAKLQNDYAPRGFQVLSTAIEDMASMTVPDFIKRFNPSFPVGYNERTTVQEYLQHPAMFKMTMPQLVLIDRQGTIQAQFAGDNPIFSNNQEQNLREKIEPLLKDTSSVPQRSTRARK
jgi:peroxiredoxin